MGIGAETRSASSDRRKDDRQRQHPRDKRRRHPQSSTIITRLSVPTSKHKRHPDCDLKQRQPEQARQRHYPAWRHPRKGR